MSSAAVAAGRRAAEREMADTFTAYVPGDLTKDADGMETQSYETAGSTLGKLQGRSRDSDSNTRTINIGGVDRDLIEGGLHLPVDAPAPAVGDIGTGWEYVLTSPGPATPADLLNSRWLVVDAPAKSYMTARRLDVVRLS